MKHTVTLKGEALQTELKELQENPKTHQLLSELHKMGYVATEQFQANMLGFCSAVNGRAKELGLSGRTIGSIAEAMVCLEHKNGFTPQ